MFRTLYFVAFKFLLRQTHNAPRECERQISAIFDILLQEKWKIHLQGVPTSKDIKRPNPDLVNAGYLLQ
jgi:hypothetical protein